MRYLAVALLVALAAVGLYLLRDDPAERRSGDREAAPEKETRTTTPAPVDDASPDVPGWLVVGSVTPAGLVDPVAHVLLVADNYERILVSGPVRDGAFAVAAPQIAELSDVQRQAGELAVRVESEGRRPGRSDTVALRDRAPGEVRLDVVVDEGGAVTGRVMDRDGRPVPDAEVWFGPKELHKSTVTAADGRYVLPVDTAAQYWICSRRGDLGAAVVGPLHITAAGLHAEDLLLRGPGALNGVAVYPDGTPARHFDVFAVPEALHDQKISSWPPGRFDGSVPREPGLSWGWARTGADGRFAISGLRRARYWFMKDKGRTLYDIGAEARLVIVNHRIRVYLRDDSGKAVHGYAVSARTETGSSMAGFTNEDAMIDIDADPGEEWIITIGSTTIEPVARRVRVREEPYDYEVILPVRIARERGRLEVALRDPQGEPIPDCRVSLYTPDGDVILYEDKLEANRTPLVPVGRYRIVVAGSHLALYLPAEGEVEVRADGVEPVTLAARPCGRLRFTFKTDRSLSGVRIKATPQHGDETVWLNSPFYPRPDGGYTWGGRWKTNEPVLTWQRLEPGPWKLEIEPNGFAPHTVPVNVRPGELLDVELDLVPAETK